MPHKNVSKTFVFPVLYERVHSNVAAMSSVLGLKIRVARKAKRLSQHDLAVLVGSSKSYMCELENRKKPNPGRDMLIRVAAALDITPEHLFADSTITPEDVITDQAFFKCYQALSPEAKQHMRKIIRTFADD